MDRFTFYFIYIFWHLPTLLFLFGYMGMAEVSVHFGLAMSLIVWIFDEDYHHHHRPHFDCDY